VLAILCMPSCLGFHVLQFVWNDNVLWEISNAYYCEREYNVLCGLWVWLNVSATVPLWSAAQYSVFTELAAVTI
jgi:hypothetical protein